MIAVKKILKLSTIFVLFFLVSCSSIPKNANNACSIFSERYLWYKNIKKASEIYNAPVHIILAFIYCE